MLHARARLNADLRAFFAARGVLEVETPLLCATTATDLHLHSFVVQAPNVSGSNASAGSVAGSDEKKYLQTSPEFAMKRLLAAGSGPIYQLGKAFRAGDLGTRHNPEFTLLEWYRPGYTLAQLMDETEALLVAMACSAEAEPASSSTVGSASAEQTSGNTAGSASAEHPRPDGTMLFARCDRTTYRVLFETRFAVNPHAADVALLRDLVVRETTFAAADTLDAAACLDLLFAMVIEPTLGHARPLFVFDFPVTQAALARVVVNAAGDRVAARCEVYVRGMELANGYDELTDAVEQRRRFVADNRLRVERGLPAIPVDENLLAAMAQGLPVCSGIALGVDRLLMWRTGAVSIDAVLAFGPSRL